MTQLCPCSAIGPGVQTFRIRDIDGQFKKVETLGPDYPKCLESRAVWICSSCAKYFARIQVPSKDIEEFLIPMESGDWQSWDWGRLAEQSNQCRWRGPKLDSRYVL